jgi:hypothetical protein
MTIGQQDSLRKTGATLIDLCVVLVVAAVVLGAGCSAAISGSREMANRVKCASNLKQLGLALAMYSNNETRNAQSFARTYFQFGKDMDSIPLIGTDAGAPNPTPGYNQPLSFGKPGEPSPVGSDNVMASFFLLQKTQDLSPAVFNCPTAGTKPDPFNDPAKPDPTRYSGWDAPANKYLSYSMQVPFPTSAAIVSGWKWNAAISPDDALMADINPGSPEVLTVTPESTRLQLQAANSPNHLGEGQNVLYGDFHVEWQTTPFAGMAIHIGSGRDVQDNIYASLQSATDFKSSQIIGKPTDRADSVLLPVAGQGFKVQQ